MNLDLVMYAFVLVCGPVAVLATVKAFPLATGAAQALTAVLIGWLMFTALATVPRIGPFPGALFGILLPVIVVGGVMSLVPSVRAVIDQANVPLLVALHTTRVAGGLFILLYAEGRLSDPFASIAGWGDLLAASLAIPAAIIAWHARLGWEKWVLGWNVIGFADFISAIALGVLSQPGSPLRMFFDAPGTALLGKLPWRFIPSYFVSLYLMIHIALFVRLVPAVFGRRRNPQPVGATCPVVEQVRAS